MIYEDNIILKKPMKMDIRFGLTYPNVYKTAMSSLGYQIVYNIINERTDTFCERIVYPNNRSIETNSPLKDFNIIGFSLQYEQDYFNLLKILKKGDIPLKRENRSENDPLIIAGGPCASSNPTPLNDFIDIFIVGEGEVILNKFLDKYKELNNPKKELDKFLEIDGIYIPEYNNKTQLTLIENMDNGYHIENPIVIKTNEKEFEPVFKNAILINVSRGCSRGCRFCMSGYLYRPTRETSKEKLIDICEKSRKNSQLNRVALIGGAVSDYSNIDDLISELLERGFEVSTPSLRIESINKKTLRLLKESGLKTLTIAPETIYKLRKSLNKNIPDEIIKELIKNAIEIGFNIKLYFLIGVPGEKEEDLEELVKYIKEIDSMKKLSNKKISIKFSINPLIPKPHTPLQWDKYDLKSIKKKIKYLKKELKDVNIKIDSGKLGLIQYILSCGDSSIGKLLEKSLNEKILLKEWSKHIPHYDIDDELPWDIIDIGLDDDFLKEEREKMSKLELTPYCIEDGCYNCGNCDDKTR